MDELRLLTPGKAQVDTGMVGIGHIMPDALLLDAAHTHDFLGDKLENPVQVVRAPVVEDAAGDRFVRMPVVTGMRVAADKGLDVEDRADGAALQYLLDGEEIGVDRKSVV